MDEELVERVVARVISRLCGVDGGASIANPASFVRRHIAARRLRDRYFEPSLFADPAWDMLLDLYAAEMEDARVPVSSLCIAAAVPPTTALRALARLQEYGLVERRSDEFDKRRCLIRLSPRASTRLKAYFKAIG